MKRRILLLILSATMIFILTGCGSDNGNFQTTTAEPLYTVKGIITDTTINGAPVRKADGSVVSFTDFQNFIAVIGWYNEAGIFVEIPSTRSEITSSGEFTISYNTNPLKNKNLVVRVVNNDGTKSYESILPMLDNGTNYVETLTPISSKKVQIIKTLVNMGLDDTLSVGEVISILRPSYIAQLDNDDIATLTKAIAGFYKNELDALSSTSISQQDYENIKEYGFTLSKNIIDDIQTGKYLKEDNIWRVYRHRLKAYAMKYLRESSQSNAPLRRAPALSASDEFTEVDMIFHATDASIVKLQTDALDGNIEIMDFESGSITSVPLSGTDTVNSVMDSIVRDQTIYSKVDFIVSECIKMANRVAYAASLFGHSISFAATENEIDNFLVDYQNIDFASVSDAQDYIDVAAFTVKNTVASKLSELMWAESSDSVSGIRELNTITPVVMLAVINDLTNALDPASATYDSRLANIYSYSKSSGASDYNPLTYALQDRDDFLAGTPLSFTESLDETLYMADFIATSFVNNINTNLSSTSFSWNASEVLAMANIMTDVTFLQIERPLEVMDYEGIYYEISGTLKRYSQREKVGTERFQYYLTDTLTGKILAYVNTYDDGTESTMYSIATTNPLYSSATTLEYTDSTGNTVIDTPANFSSMLGSDIWYFKYYENYDTIYAHSKTTASLDSLLNTHYKFMGYLRPPNGAFSGTTLVNIEQFGVEPYRFNIADYTAEVFDMGPYVGEQVDEVFGKIYWDASNTRYLVINSSYTTGDNLVCPTQEPTQTYNYYEYWQLDYSSAVTTDSSGAFVAWNPNDYTLTDKVWRIWGRLEDRVVNGSTITKTLNASRIEEEETTNPSAGFYVVGVVTGMEKRSGRWTIQISDVNDLGSAVMYIYSSNNYSNVVNWFDAARGSQVTIGDPDITDNTDGITMEVVDQIWDDSLGAYTLTIDALYDGAFTNGEPDWARLDF